MEFHAINSRANGFENVEPDGGKTVANGKFQLDRTPNKACLSLGRNVSSATSKLVRCLTGFRERIRANIFQLLFHRFALLQRLIQCSFHLNNMWKESHEIAIVKKYCSGKMLKSKMWTKRGKRKKRSLGINFSFCTSLKAAIFTLNWFSYKKSKYWLYFTTKRSSATI